MRQRARGTRGSGAALFRWPVWAARTARRHRIERSWGRPCRLQHTESGGYLSPARRDADVLKKAESEPLQTLMCAITAESGVDDGGAIEQEYVAKNAVKRDGPE